MPSPVPVLDRRSYEQLRDGLARRIAVYTPEWTDLNESDPGITLVEMFAFVAETLLWLIDERERHRRRRRRRVALLVVGAAVAGIVVRRTSKNGTG